MAIIKSLPAVINATIPYSTFAGITEDLVLKLVPRNPDGTIYDCTPLTSVNCFVQSAGQQLFGYAATPSCSLGTHDATGVSVTISGLQNILRYAGALEQQITIGGYTATDGILLGMGKIKVTLGV